MLPQAVVFGRVWVLLDRQKSENDIDWVHFQLVDEVLLHGFQKLLFVVNERLVLLLLDAEEVLVAPQGSESELVEPNPVSVDDPSLVVGLDGSWRSHAERDPRLDLLGADLMNWRISVARWGFTGHGLVLGFLLQVVGHLLLDLILLSQIWLVHGCSFLFAHL